MTAIWGTLFILSLGACLWWAFFYTPKCPHCGIRTVYIRTEDPAGVLFVGKLQLVIIGWPREVRRYYECPECRKEIIEKGVEGVVR